MTEPDPRHLIFRRTLGVASQQTLSMRPRDGCRLKTVCVASFGPAKVPVTPGRSHRSCEREPPDPAA